MFFREYNHVSTFLQGSCSWDHHGFVFHILPSYSRPLCTWVTDLLDLGGMSLKENLKTLMWKCTWKSLTGLVPPGRAACGKSGPCFTCATCLSWVQHRETAAPQNQSCKDFCNFWAERHVLRDELSTSMSALGILWKFSGLMITHVISWRGWWSLSHPRKHPRCLFPNAEIYSSSFELFFQESFQFCGSHYKTRIFNYFEKPSGLRGKYPRLPDHPENHLYFCRAGAANQGEEQLGSGWARD